MQVEHTEEDQIVALEALEAHAAEPDARPPLVLVGEHDLIGGQVDAPTVGEDDVRAGRAVAHDRQAPRNRLITPDVCAARELDEQRCLFNHGKTSASSYSEQARCARADAGSVVSATARPRSGSAALDSPDLAGGAVGGWAVGPGQVEKDSIHHQRQERGKRVRRVLQARAQAGRYSTENTPDSFREATS